MSGSKLSNPSAPAAADAAAPAAGRRDAPLSLTVHAMPSPDGVAQADTQRTRLGRWQMLLVLALCAAPVVASYTMYYLVRPDGRHSNYGELITPQRPLPDVAAQTLDGKPANLRELKGQWLLLSVAGGGCDAVCERHLYLQRQLRETLGKEKARLDWIWLVNDDAPIKPGLLPALKEAMVLRVAPTALAHWLAPAAGNDLAPHLYLVDPMGNWMMRFPPGLELKDAAQIKRDLDRLLRASASWDQPGR
jgi:hypothetical protein